MKKFSNNEESSIFKFIKVKWIKMSVVNWE